MVEFRVYLDWAKLHQRPLGRYVTESLFPDFRQFADYHVLGPGSDANGDYILLRTDSPDKLRKMIEAAIDDEAVTKLRLPSLHRI